MGFFKDMFNAFTGGIIDYSGSYASRKADMRDWKEQQAILHQYQKDMVDYQNEATMQLRQHDYENYSSPTAVMNAYQKAGINPNLVAGSISGTPANITSASGGISAASKSQYPMGYSMLREQQKQARMASEYQQQEIEMRDLQIRSQELELQKSLSDIMSPEFHYYEDESGNRYEPDEYDKLPQGLKEGLERIEASDDDRIIRGLQNRNLLKNNQLMSTITKVSADLLEQRIRQDGLQKVKDEGLYDVYLLAKKAEGDAKAAKEYAEQLENSNAISVKSIGKDIDNADIPDWAKTGLKMIVAKWFNLKD